MTHEQDARALITLAERLENAPNKFEPDDGFAEVLEVAQALRELATKKGGKKR